MHDQACIIDDLVVTSTALSPASPGSANAAQTAVHLRSATGPGLKFWFPFFVRGLSPANVSVRWPAICGLLRRHGLPIFSTVAELTAVSAADSPARIAVRNLNQPFAKSELSCADAIVLNNQDLRGFWVWPYEVDGPHDLQRLVGILRQATEGQLPIGMTLPLGAKQADLRVCIESKIDFLTLAFSSENLAMGSSNIASFTALSVHAARRFCVESGMVNLPILVDSPITASEHLIKLLAMGATAVNVASVIRHAMVANEPKVSESRLAENLLGVRPTVTKSVKEIPEAERELERMIEQLKSVLYFAGALDISHFDVSYLRSLQKSTADTLGIPLASTR
jgi:hypothetical protein